MCEVSLEAITDRRILYFGLGWWQRMKEKEENQEIIRKSNQQELDDQLDKGCREKGAPKFLARANGSTAFFNIKKENKWKRTN